MAIDSRHFIANFNLWLSGSPYRSNLKTLIGWQNSHIPCLLFICEIGCGNFVWLEIEPTSRVVNGYCAILQKFGS